MASLFDAMDRRAQAVITDRLGAVVAFLGQIAGDFATAADPEKPQIEAVAVTAITARAGEVADGIQSRSSTGSMHIHGTDEMWMPRETFDALAWRPEQGDIVLTQPGTARERRFQITAVLPHGDDDIQITLAAVGSGAQ
jgi:hypothetical protein